jgi:hypothetical protein
VKKKFSEGPMRFDPQERLAKSNKTSDVVDGFRVAITRGTTRRTQSFERRGYTREILDRNETR